MDEGFPVLEMKTAESFNVELRICCESNKSSKEGRAGKCFAYLSFVKSFRLKTFLLVEDMAEIYIEIVCSWLQ